MSAINKELNSDLLYSFPSDWKLIEGYELFRQVNTRVKDVNSEVSIPVLSMTRYSGLVLQSKKFGKQVASRDISNYKVVENGQLVYGFPIDEGVIAIQHRFPIGAVSPAYHVWNIIKEVDLTYLDMVLKTPFMIRNYSKFASNVVHRRRNLSPSDFLQVSVPLPPFSEQIAIANTLVTIRHAIEVTGRVIEAAYQLKKSMIQHLILNMADEWISRNLPEVVDIRSGGTPNTKVNEYWNGDIDWVSAEDVSLSIGPFIKNTKRKITDLGLKNCAAQILPANTIILIARGATMGRVKVLSRPMAMNQTCYGLVAKHDYDPLFIFYLLESMMDEFQRLAYGAIFTTVTTPNLREMKLPTPGFDKQKDISRQLFAVDKKILAELKYKETLEVVFDSLLNYLMTGKIRIN